MASVDTVIVQTRPLMIYDEVSGRTFSHRKVDVRSQVDGIIRKRYFEEGSVAHKGDILHLLLVLKSTQVLCKVQMLT